MTDSHVIGAERNFLYAGKDGVVTGIIKLTGITTIIDMQGRQQDVETSIDVSFVENGASLKSITFDPVSKNTKE